MKTVASALKQVFSEALSVVIAVVASALAFALALWAQNFSLVVSVVKNASMPLTAKLELLAALLSGIRTNFSALSGFYTIAIVLLFGVNVAMVVYAARRRVALTGREKFFGLGAVASGVAGIGCAACGSLLLTAVLPLVGASGALALLPLRGGEFGLLSVALIIVSIYLTAKKIKAPLACSA